MRINLFSARLSVRKRQADLSTEEPRAELLTTLIIRDSRAVINYCLQLRPLEYHLFSHLTKCVVYSTTPYTWRLFPSSLSPNNNTTLFTRFTSSHTASLSTTASQSLSTPKTRVLPHITTGRRSLLTAPWLQLTPFSLFCYFGAAFHVSPDRPSQNTNRPSRSSWLVSQNEQLSEIVQGIVKNGKLDLSIFSGTKIKRQHIQRFLASSGSATSIGCSDTRTVK